jgi:Glycosyl hydrolases family 6
MAIRFEAAFEHAVPVLAAYDIPGRDCAQYSAGGALDQADYEAAGWRGRATLKAPCPSSLLYGNSCRSLAAGTPRWTGDPGFSGATRHT